MAARPADVVGGVDEHHAEVRRHAHRRLPGRARPRPGRGLGSRVVVDRALHFNQLVTYAPAPRAPSLKGTSPPRCPRSRTAASPTAARPTRTTCATRDVPGPGSSRGHGGRLQWSLERMLNPKMSPRSPAGYLYASIVGVDALGSGKAAHASGIKVIDRYTLQIDLTQPDYVFNDVMSLPFAAVQAKEWVAKICFEQRHLTRPTRWAPVRSCSTTGPAARRSCSSATRTTSSRVTRTSTSSSSSSPRASRPPCCSSKAAGSLRRARRRHPLGPGRAGHGQPDLEEAGHDRSSDRLVLRVHERPREAVQQRARAPRPSTTPSTLPRSRSCSTGRRSR